MLARSRFKAKNNLSHPREYKKRVNGRISTMDKKGNAGDDLLRKKMQVLNSGTISDVLDGIQVSGTLPGVLRRLSGRPGPVVGRAYTVQWAQVRKGRHISEPQPSTWEQIRNFLTPDLKKANGLVYVGGAGDVLTEAALAGGLSATYLQKVGFEGIVLGGAVRDASILDDLSIPVIGTNFIPTDTQGAYRVAAIGASCRVGEIVINTGDWIVSDTTGTVVIPSSRAEEVVERALEIERLEEQILERLARGERLPEVIDDLKRI
ncbi:MAG: RraA family protein [Sulfuricaulis sp.]